MIILWGVLIREHTFHIYKGRFRCRIKKRVLAGQLLLTRAEVVRKIGLKEGIFWLRLRITDEEEQKVKSYESGVYCYLYN